MRRRHDRNRRRSDSTHPSTAVPLYHQIFLQLRDEILAGIRPFGTAVPTEMDLARACSVSRITARRALAELARQNLVARKRRVGTTVIFRTPTRPIEAKMDQAVDSLIDFVSATKVQVLSLKKEPAESWVARIMHLDPGTPVIRAERVRSLDKVLIGFVISYVPAALNVNVTRRTLASQPILSLIKRAGYRLGEASQTVSASIADPLICHTLQIEPLSPVLRITRSVFDPVHRPLLLTIAHYRGDRYQLRLDLHH